MQKTNNEFVETVLMAIPADMLEEVGIEPCSTVQMHVSRGRIIIQAVDSLDDQNILRPKLQEIALIFALALDKVVNRQPVLSL